MIPRRESRLRRKAAKDVPPKDGSTAKCARAKPLVVILPRAPEVSNSFLETLTIRDIHPLRPANSVSAVTQIFLMTLLGDSARVSKAGKRPIDTRPSIPVKIKCRRIKGEQKYGRDGFKTSVRIDAGRPSGLAIQACTGVCP